MADDRSNLQIKLDAFQRLIMINCFANKIPLAVLTEYPKSGGTWIGQMVAEVLRLPFPRNERAAFKASLLHTHLLYNRWMKNVIVVFRDGRDVLVSQYFHMLFENEKSSPILVKNTRKDLHFRDYQDVESNLPRFIEYVFEKESKSISPYHFTWSQFANSWLGRDVAIVKYEDMVAGPDILLRDVAKRISGENPDDERVRLAVETYSFEKQANRKPGEENRTSFLRKGRPGDWREKFSRKSAVLFDELAGAELVELGYVADRTWVNSV